MEESVTRFEMYCQLKKLAQSDTALLLVGIDVGKHRHTACLRVRDQRLVKNFSFANSRAGFEGLREKVAELKQKKGVITVLYGLESTGNYQKPLAYFLQQAGEHVVQVSTLAVRRNRETVDVSWDKSDRKDAENIADLLHQGKFFYYDGDADGYAQVRQLVRQDAYLHEEQKKIKIKLRNDVLSCVFPELDRLFSQMGSPLLRRLLGQLPFPAEIRQLSEVEFTQRLGPVPARSRAKVQLIYQAAGQSIGIESEKEALRLGLNYLLTRYDQLDKEIGQVREQMAARLSGVADYKNLQTIPGVGPLLAAVIWSEVGDIGRYSHARQLVKLAGLDIARYQSGTFCSVGKISKRGRKVLRRAAFHAAVAAISHAGPFKERYGHLLARHGQHPIPMKAILAVASKILRIVFRVLKAGIAYDPAYDLTLQIKYKQVKPEAKKS